MITTLLNEKQLEHIQHFTIFRYTTAKTTGAYTFDKIFWMSVMPVDDSLIIFCITFWKKKPSIVIYDNAHPGIIIFIVILSTFICWYGWNHKPWCIHIYSVSFFEFTWLNLCHLLLALSKKPNITSWFSVQNFTHETLYSAFEYSCEKCCFWPHSPETVKFVLFLVVLEIVKCTCIQTKQLQPKLMHQKSSSFEFVIFPFQLWIFAGRCIKGFVC